MNRLQRVRYCIARYLFVGLMAAGAAFVLTGCNAMAGLGRDVTGGSTVLRVEFFDPLLDRALKREKTYDDGLTDSQRAMMSW